jgi:hypothetical protein
VHGVIVPVQGVVPLDQLHPNSAEQAAGVVSELHVGIVPVQLVEPLIQEQ